MHLVPLIGLLYGAASAALFIYGLVAGTAGLFLMALSPLPLWMAGLGWGSTAAGLAGAVAAIATLIVGGPFHGSAFALFVAIPAAILVQFALAKREVDGEERYFPLSALLGSLVAIGLIQALVVSLYFASTADGLVGTVRHQMIISFGQFITEDLGEGTDPLIDQWDSLFMGAVIAAIMIAQAVSGALAQALLASVNRAQRPTPAFWALRVGDWMRWLIVPLLVLAVALDATGTAADGGIGGFAQFLAMAFVLALGVGFLLQGLAVMHALTRGMRAQPFVLAGVYFIALAMQPFGTALFGLIGFFDRWGNFRERFGADGGDDMED